MPLKPIGIQKRTVTAILGAALLAVMFFSVALVIYWNRLLPARVENFLAPAAEMINVGTAAAVDLADAPRAQEFLNSLKSNPQILRADILLPDGHLLATYPPTNAPPDTSWRERPDGIYFAGGNAEMVRRLAASEPRPARLFIRMSLGVMHQRQQQALLELACVVGFVLILIVLLQFVLLRRWVLSPLAQMAAIAETAGQQGDYSQRMPAHDRDEFGLLGKSFNNLLAAIEQRTAALERLSSDQRAILDHAAYAIIPTDAQGVITGFNPAAERLLGYSAAEVVGRHTPEMFHLPAEVAARAAHLSEKFGEPVAAGFETFVAEARRGLRSEVEWTHVRKDGSQVPVLLSVTALRDERGGISGYLGMAVELTERKQAEVKLQESEAQYRLLFENMITGFALHEIICDADGQPVDYRFLEINPAYERLTGLEAGRLLGRTVSEALPAVEKYWIETFGRVALSGKPVAFENFFADLGKYYDTWVFSPKPGQFAVVFSDVTARKQAEMKLREALEFNQQLVTASLIGIEVFNLDGSCVLANQSAARILGATREQLLAQNCWQIDSWKRSEIRSKAEAVFAAGTPEQFEIHLQTTFGREIWAECIFSRFNSGGEPRLLILLSDTSPRRQAEESLRESQRLYEELVSSVPLGVYRASVREGGVIVLEYVSERFCELLGIERDAVLANAAVVFNLIHPNDRGQFDRLNAEAISNRSPFTWEGRAAIRGQTRWLHVASRPTVLPDRPVFWTGVMLDVTERQNVEEALRQNHSLLEGTLEATADGILAVSSDGKITSYNRQFAELWRVPKEILDTHDSVALTDYVLHQLKDPVASQKRAIQFNDTSKADTFDMVEFKDNRVFERFSRPQFVAGRVVGRVWSFRDVTARHWAVASLRESEHKFKTLFETANDAILIMDGMVCVDCNRISEVIYGSPREKIIGGTPVQFSPERQADGRLSAEKAAEKVQAALAGTPQFFEWIHVRGDGALFNAEVSLNRLELRGQMVLQVIVRDITARKQAEAARREAEELYRTLVNTSPDGICVLDMEGRIQFSSPKALELFYGSAEAASPPGRNAVELVSEEHRVQATELLRAAMAGKFPPNERLLMRRAEGGTFVAELNGTMLRDGLGVPRGIMVIARDVTDRQRQEDELKNKNAELERFTYTVSHDLKSPLITIKGFAGALMSDAAKGRIDRLPEDLKRIILAADKMTDLLNGLLELSRIGRIVNPPIKVSMEKLATDTLELLAGSIKLRSAKVTVRPGLPEAYGDPQRLAEVLQNLVENALKFPATGRAPEIEIGCEAAGDQSVYFVRDHGQGIEARYHETIFGLFNKLDTRSEGTGIGLALVRRIVEFHGGHIWVESAGLGQGATFYFTLPAQPALSGAPTD